MSQCLKVHEYMPGYINDLIVFLRYEPYELERAALKKWQKCLKGINDKPGLNFPHRGGRMDMFFPR